MSGDELCHLEHGHFALATEEGLELLVREDVALVRRILEIILLDVLPELLDYLTARHRPRAGNRLELRRELHRLQECWICFSNHSDVSELNK